MKGYFTVELSLIFPIVFVILIILMQYGLFFTYRILADSAINRSLMVCSQARNIGMSSDEALECAENYLKAEFEKLPVEIIDMKWEQSVGWLKEEYSVEVSVQYSFLISLSWSSEQDIKRMNPVEFRNRLDFVWEKGRKYLEWENQ